MEQEDAERQMGIWRALFDFAQQVGANDPVNNRPSTFERLSPEDVAFLEASLNDLTSDTDHLKQMKEQIKYLLGIDLHNPNAQSIEKGMAALDHLKETCEVVDFASDFYKIGGFKILIPLLSSIYAPFRASAAELIGNVSQNHSFCQEKICSTHILNLLLELAKKDMDGDVKLKSLYAISCLVRDYPVNEKTFIERDGLCLLLNFITDGSRRLKLKSIFLLSHLFACNEAVKDLALNMGILDALTSLLNEQDDQIREMATRALLSLVQNHTVAIEECQREELALKAVLQQRIEEISNKSEQEEELEACQQLINICWPQNKQESH